ncbi:hypothetical protein pb186bvf_011727 [Paramecium bursaria]
MGSYLEAPKTEIETEQLQTDLFECYAASMQGWRITMEDAHICEKVDENVYLFAIFDGHGGPDISKFVKQNFVNQLKQNEEFKSKNYSLSLTQVFQELDQLILQLCVKNQRTGSCAVVALIADNTLYVANLGDSRCLLQRDLEVIEMTKDHTPNIFQESLRIRKAGGVVDDYGRLNSQLSVSRAFGVFEFKGNVSLASNQQQVICVPEIRKIKLNSDDKFLFLGCDGMFETLNNFQIMQTILRKQDGSVLEDLMKQTLALDTSTGYGFAITYWYKTRNQTIYVETFKELLDKELANEIDLTKHVNQILIFITPWNKLGYQYTLDYAQKIDYVSPVWYNIEKDLQLNGNNENPIWINDIKKKNPNIKIIPRVYLNIEIKQLQQFLEKGELIEKIVQVSKLYDGIIFDSPYVSYLDHQEVDGFLSYLQSLSKQIKNQNKLFMTSIFSYIDKTFINQQTLKKLVRLSDLLLIQTYDPAEQYELKYLSPYDWFKENVEEVLIHKKILFGLPFFGYEQTNQIRHITQDNIVGLNPNLYKLEWNNQYKECIIKGENKIITYPCPQFIKQRIDLLYEHNFGVFVWDGGQGLKQLYNLL